MKKQQRQLKAAAQKGIKKIVKTSRFADSEMLQSYVAINFPSLKPSSFNPLIDQLLNARAI